MPRALNVVGIFAGIGGFELGFRAAGHRTVMVCESDPLCRIVLANFGCKISSDIFDLKRIPQGTDVITAGFPCQSFSPAGTTLGLHRPVKRLLEKLFELIGHSAPEFVVLENVPFIRFVDDGGAGLRMILRRLEALGYRWAYRIVDSQAFGLPQRRRRWLLVASLSNDPAAILLNEDTEQGIAGKDTTASAFGFYWTEGNTGLGWTRCAVPPLKSGSGLGIPSPPAVWDVRGRRVLVPGIRDAERLQGFDADWTGFPELGRTRWRMVGNAVSVPVALWLASRLQTRETFSRNAIKLKRGDRWPVAAFGSPAGRYAVSASAYPRNLAPEGILEFLKEPSLLSYRATKGFYRRAKATTKLRIDAAFLEAIHDHMSAMKSITPDLSLQSI